VSSPAYSKAKGRTAENHIVNTLRVAFPQFQFIARKRQTGAKDEGDITGMPSLTIEAKARGKLDLSGWTREATVEAGHAGNPVGVVWHKKRGTTDPLEWYVSMTGAMFIQLLHMLYGDEI
jgi:hypothetical protein